MLKVYKRKKNYWNIFVFVVMVGWCFLVYSLLDERYDTGEMCADEISFSSSSEVAITLPDSDPESEQAWILQYETEHQESLAQSYNAGYQAAYADIIDSMIEVGGFLCPEITPPPRKPELEKVCYLVRFLPDDTTEKIKTPCL